MFINPRKAAQTSMADQLIVGLFFEVGLIAFPFIYLYWNIISLKEVFQTDVQKFVVELALVTPVVVVISIIFY